MRTILFIFGCAGAVLLGPLASGASAQEASRETSFLEPRERDLILDSISVLLRDYHVSPETGFAYALYLEDQRALGVYESYASPSALAEVLSGHLQQLRPDLHLRLRTRPYLSPSAAEGETEAEREHRREMLLERNFGLTRIEILEGNIGYLELEWFADLNGTDDAIAHAMDSLSEVSALVIDLRNTSGGSPEKVALLASYLFGERRVLLGTIYWRARDTTEEFWTVPTLPAPRYADGPVYVLTSFATAGGGEQLAYDLKHLGRAIIVGERTAGEAHSTTAFPVGHGLELVVPLGRPVNPVTHTNWEGRGVEPDVVLPAREALDWVLREVGRSR